MDLPPINVLFSNHAAEIIASVIPTIAAGIGFYKYFGNTPEEETLPEEQRHKEEE